MRNRKKEGGATCSMKGWPISFLAGVPTSWQSILALLVHFEHPVWKAMTLEEVREYNNQMVSTCMEDEGGNCDHE